MGIVLAKYITSFCFFEFKLLSSEDKIELIDHFVISHPLWASLLGGLYRGAYGEALTGKLQTRFFLSYNDEVLSPIRQPRPLDPLWGSPGEDDEDVTEWVKPSGTGQRGEAWEALFRFARHSIGDGRVTWWAGRPRIPEDEIEAFAFRWAVLTGRAGAGKTRMAMEFARTLARREARQHYWSWIGLCIGDWYRRACPSEPRHPRDPWDAGWLKPIQNKSVGRDAHSSRQEIDPGFLRRLAAWEPRRPTFLLLDDPLPGDGERIVNVLASRSSEYRFPVRLLIIDQAIPADLMITRSATDLEWRRGFSGELIQLGSESGLTDDEIFRFARNARLDSSLRQTEGNFLARLILVTRRNPLLVELALRWLKQGGKLDELSQERLLADRAARIAEALNLAGFDDPQHQCALAAATLAGPADTYVPSPMFSRGKNLQAHDPIASAFPRGVFDRDKLLLLFNVANPVDGALPPVRPELVGDAFVRYVIAHNRASEVSAIVPTAWRLSALGTLRTMRRVVRGAPKDDALASALRKAPPADTDLDLLDLALAYAETAIQIPREEWDALVVGDSDENLDAALRRIGDVPAQIAVENLSRFISIMDVPSDHAIARGVAGFACFCAVINRGLDDENFWSVNTPNVSFIGKMIQVFELTNLWGVECNTVREGRTFWEIPGRLIEALAASFHPDVQPRSELLERFEITLVNSAMGLPITVARCFLAMAKLETASPDDIFMTELSSIREYRFKAYALAISANYKELLSTTDMIEKRLAISEFREDRKFQLERIKLRWIIAWTHAYVTTSVAYRDDLIIGDVEVIVQKFADDIEIQKHIVGILYYTCVYHARRYSAAGRLEPNTQLDRCKSAAARVDELASKNYDKSGISEFSFFRASAWASVSMASQIHLSDCETARGQVEAVTRSFRGERNFEFARVEALVALLHANQINNRRTACEKIKSEIEAIIAPFTGQRFFELARVHAWRFATAVRFNQYGRLGFEEGVRRIETIVRPFAGQWEFEIEIAWMLSLRAGACRGDRIAFNKLLQEIEKISEPFKELVQFQDVLNTTRSYVT